MTASEEVFAAFLNPFHWAAQLACKICDKRLLLENWLLKPKAASNVRLADGVIAVFRVTGVREYLKAHFPASTVYGTTRHAALRLITCGGSFDYATRHYLSSTVVFASLESARRPGPGRA